MATYTNLPSGYPFYGGIIQEYGVGLHEDWDATIRKGEPMRADYLNFLEHRVNRLEHVVNQLEHMLLLPSGSINTDLPVTTDPDTTYYRNTNAGVIASGVNRLVQLLSLGSTVTVTNVPGYPFSAGTMI